MSIHFGRVRSEQKKDFIFLLVVFNMIYDQTLFSYVILIIK